MKTLITVATRTENQFNPLPKDTDILITGIGKLNAAIRLALKLSEKKYERIINVGLCGCIDKTYPISKIFSIEKVIEGDLEPLLGRSEIPLFPLSGNSFEETLLVTQDRAVLTEDQRNHLKGFGAFLADMECFALAKTAKALKIPFHAFKIISDHADSSTLENVRKNALSGSTILCRAVRDLIDTLG